jgi:hypothetical protein
VYVTSILCGAPQAEKSRACLGSGFEAGANDLQWNALWRLSVRWKIDPWPTRVRQCEGDGRKFWIGMGSGDHGWLREFGSGGLC